MIIYIFHNMRKCALMTFVPSEDSDQPVHPHRLIRMKSSQETIYRELTIQGFQYNTVVQLIFPGPLWSWSPFWEFRKFIWGSPMRLNWPKLSSLCINCSKGLCWSWWLIGMHVGLVIRRLRVWSPPGPTTFFHLGLIIKYFLQPFSSFRWFKKGSCKFLMK